MTRPPSADETQSGPPPRTRGSRWRTWAPPAVALAVTALIVATAPVRGTQSGSAVQDALGGHQLRIMAPAAPGGGWDQTSREMQKALRDLVGRTEVYNVSGAGGTIGLSQFTRLDGDPAQLMVTGLVMVGAVAANKAPYSLADTTPLARLTTDYAMVVVPADSPIRSVQDLAAALQADPGKVSVAGGSAGGAEQILSGLLAKAVGVDPSRIGYVAHSGGGEALSTLLSGRATIGISGVSELAPQVRAGTVRALAVSSPQRLGTVPDVPTLREGGLDVELQNWRGVVAPKGISPEQAAALEGLLVDMTRTREWRDALARRGWEDAVLAGPPFADFVRSEQARVTQVLTEIKAG